MINLKGIKNIIFDFGDVICDIDFQRTVDAFSLLSAEKLSITIQDYIHHPIFGGLEKGEIDLPQFRNELRSLLKTEATDEAIDNAWAQVIINSDYERMVMLEQLNVNYRVFLLSNTNEIHVNTAFHRINETFQVNFNSFFEVAYFSHLLGMAKPNPDIYNHVLNDAGILAQETLFIDDNEANIIAAQKLGIRTYHLKPREEKVVDLFR